MNVSMGWLKLYRANCGCQWIVYNVTHLTVQWNRLDKWLNRTLSFYFLVGVYYDSKYIAYSYPLFYSFLVL